mmetsp:Transcript_33114/g.68339  ORF Transcript_33114/g.68339 Transcript_33114/m.68339 type:complete len:326 (-) Transcript_33114:13-990(-)
MVASLAKPAKLLVLAVIVVILGFSSNVSGEAMQVLHAGILEIPDFDAIVRSHLPPSQDDYFNPYNPTGQRNGVHIFDLPKFHLAHGEAHHTSLDPEAPQPKTKKGLTRIGSVSKKLYASNIGQVLEICPGSSQPILRGQLADDRLRKVFDSLDTDGSGDLGIDEIREAFIRLGMPKPEAQMTELFANMDVNGDKKVTFTEFHDAIRLVAAKAGQEGLLDVLQLHPGTWIKHMPDDIPNLEIEPRYYRSQWLGEDKLGGCWSSESNPLSGDRPKGTSELYSPKETIPEGKEVRKDADGNVHIVSKKTVGGKIEGDFLHPTSSSLLI